MRKGTTALSAGALTLALSGVVLPVTAPAFASAPRIAGCEPTAARGARCDDVTEPANAPGTRSDPLGDALDDLAGQTDRLLDDVGDAARNLLGDPPSASPEPRGRSTSSPENRGRPSGTPSGRSRPDDDGEAAPEASPRDDDLLGLPIGDCLPVVGCDENVRTSAPSPPPARDRSTPAPTASRRATPTAVPTATQTTSPPVTAAPGSPGSPDGGAGQSGAADGDGGLVARDVTLDPPRAADIEAPPLAPLWPGQPLPKLSDPLAVGKVVPTRSDDLVGTVLTAILLASAILAARIVHTRQARRGGDPATTMPLQGLHRTDNGRHRLA